MDLLATIDGMEKAGVRLRFDGERLSIETDADRPPSPALLSAIKRHQDAFRTALASPARDAARERDATRLQPNAAQFRPNTPEQPTSAQDAEPLDLTPRQLARWRRRRLSDAERAEQAAMLAFGDPRARGRR